MSESLEVRAPETHEELEAFHRLRLSLTENKHYLPGDVPRREMEPPAYEVQRAVLLDGQVRAGAIARRDHFSAERFELRSIFTAPRYERLGLGHMALQAVEAELRSYGAEVIWTVSRNRTAPFFAKAGYRAPHNRPTDLTAVAAHMVKGLQIPTGTP